MHFIELHATHLSQTADICKCSDGQNLQITKRGNILCNLILDNTTEKMSSKTVLHAYKITICLGKNYMGENKLNGATASGR